MFAESLGYHYVILGNCYRYNLMFLEVFDYSGQLSGRGLRCAVAPGIKIKNKIKIWTNVGLNIEIRRLCGQSSPQMVSLTSKLRSVGSYSMSGRETEGKDSE